jgi:O-methyltransferase
MSDRNPISRVLRKAPYFRGLYKRIAAARKAASDAEAREAATQALLRESEAREAATQALLRESEAREAATQAREAATQALLRESEAREAATQALLRVSNERVDALTALNTALSQERDMVVARLPDMQVIHAGITSLLSARRDRAAHHPQAKEDSQAADRYLDLIESQLTGTLTGDVSIDPWTAGTFDPARRAVGRDWPATAETMIGTVRMRNIRTLLHRVLSQDVPGDLIETGVWRGGACIYMRAILAAAGDNKRRVFVADSFEGLPLPNDEFPADRGDAHSTYRQLAISRADVEANFERYGLLDEQVIFLEGWFKDTLPCAPIERLSLLRLDADMYESTIQSLKALYHKVSPGGFVIIDDYILKPCAQAVDDFRAAHGIEAPLNEVDGAAVWWQVEKISNK